MRRRALLVGDVRAKGERGPSEAAARMDLQVVVYLKLEARVRLEQNLRRARAVLGPIVVFQRCQVEIRKVGVRRVIWFDLRQIEGLPGRPNLWNQRSQRLLALLPARSRGQQAGEADARQERSGQEFPHGFSSLFRKCGCEARFCRYNRSR